MLTAAFNRQGDFLLVFYSDLKCRQNQCVCVCAYLAGADNDAVLIEPASAATWRAVTNLLSTKTHRYWTQVVVHTEEVLMFCTHTHTPPTLKQAEHICNCICRVAVINFFISYPCGMTVQWLACQTCLCHQAV